MADRRFDTDETVGFIGAGRLGSSLAKAMAERGYAVRCVSRRSQEAAEEAAISIPGATAETSAQAVADSCQIVFITVGDADIAPVAASIRWTPTHAVVHCSGATPVSALSLAAQVGAAVGGWHPLQTFPAPHLSEQFDGITVGIESASPALLQWLRGLAVSLGSRPMELRAGDRAAYHASAVMACGLVAGLAGLAAQMWTTFGRTREEGVDALSPLLRQTALQMSERGLPDAITGPFVRGDVATIRAHLDATAGLGPPAQAAYAAIALAHLPIAREQGNLGVDEYATIERILTDALENP